MFQEHDLDDFVRRFHSEVIERSRGEVESDLYDGRVPEYKEDAFTEIFLEYLTQNGVTDDAEICYFHRRTGIGTVKLNAYNIDIDSARLNLFVSLFLDTEKTTVVSKPSAREIIDQGLRFIKLSLSGYHEKMEPSSPPFTMMREIHRSKDHIESIRVFILTDGVLPDSLELPESKNTDGVKFHLWDIKRLFRFISSDMRESIEINLKEYSNSEIKCLNLSNQPEDYSAYLTIFPGEMLSELYEKYGSQLFELNVRSYLQARGKVNKGIRETLKNEPGRFMAYNNGVSMTAERIDFSEDANGLLNMDKITGLQIVNGGQTVASIHRAHKIDRSDLTGVFVQAKITVIDPEKVNYIVPKISRYANSQNKVDEADFFSNEPYHIVLQKLSETIWVPGEQSRWFYERTRGSYQVNKAKEANTDARRRHFEKMLPPSQRFTKVDLAKYINCWDNLPYIVSRGGQKNFTHFMNRLMKTKGNDWVPDASYYKTLVGKAILYKGAEKIIKPLISAFRPNVVAYTISYLSFRTFGGIDFIQIWETQKIPEVISEAIKAWAPVIHQEILSTAGERNPGEWFKKEEAWLVVKALKLDMPTGLKDMITSSRQKQDEEEVTAEKPHLSDQDFENMAEVMAVDGTTWLKIHGWGKMTGQLERWQCGIALTLSGLASERWEQKPTPKQAKQGAEILRKAVPFLKADKTGGINSIES